jgi:hypothetical protein
MTFSERMKPTFWHRGHSILSGIVYVANGGRFLKNGCATAWVDQEFSHSWQMSETVSKCR